MNNRQQQIEELLAFHPGTRVVPDGGIDYIFLPNLKILVAGADKVLNALLCPAQHGGYTTRLFFSEPLSQRGQNWTVHNMAGHTWHTWSWNNVPASLSLLQILSAHLGALR